MKAQGSFESKTRPGFFMKSDAVKQHSESLWLKIFKEIIIINQYTQTEKLQQIGQI